MKYQSKDNLNFIAKSTKYMTLVLVVSFSNILCAYSDNNTFFGTSPSSPRGTGLSSEEDSNPNAVLPGLNDTMPTNTTMGTDFTGDEKRMQKKYKANLNKAQDLIEKGEQMMKSADKNHDDPVYKKGKIFKETGEKWLTELKANNPFPNQKVK